MRPYLCRLRLLTAGHGPGRAGLAWSGWRNGPCCPALSGRATATTTTGTRPGTGVPTACPALGDDVTIDTSADVVHSDSDSDTIKSLTSTAPLTISGGTLSIASAFTTSSTLTINGGTLNAPGAITVGGLLTLSGGTISGLATAGAPERHRHHHRQRRHHPQPGRRRFHPRR